MSVARQPELLPQTMPESSLMRIPEASDELDTYLNQNQTQQLDVYIASIYTHGSHEEQEYVRDRIFAYVKQRLAERQYDLADSVLQQYRLSNYRDVDTLILLADIVSAKQNIPAALDYLYEAKGYAFRQSKLDQIVHKIRTLVADYAKQLVASQRQFELLELYEYLCRQEPDFRHILSNWPEPRSI